LLPKREALVAGIDVHQRVRALPLSLIGTNPSPTPSSIVINLFHMDIRPLPPTSCIGIRPRTKLPNKKKTITGPELTKTENSVVSSVNFLKTNLSSRNSD
jgi:hypothetical protein